MTTCDRPDVKISRLAVMITNDRNDLFDKKSFLLLPYSLSVVGMLVWGLISLSNNSKTFSEVGSVRVETVLRCIE